MTFIGLTLDMATHNRLQRSIQATGKMTYAPNHQRICGDVSHCHHDSFWCHSKSIHLICTKLSTGHSNVAVMRCAMFVRDKITRYDTITWWHFERFGSRSPLPSDKTSFRPPEKNGSPSMFMVDSGGFITTAKILLVAQAKHRTFFSLIISMG